MIRGHLHLPLCFPQHLCSSPDYYRCQCVHYFIFKSLEVKQFYKFYFLHEDTDIWKFSLNTWLSPYSFKEPEDTTAYKVCQGTTVLEAVEMILGEGLHLGLLLIPYTCAQWLDVYQPQMFPRHVATCGRVEHPTSRHLRRLFTQLSTGLT